MSDRRFQFCLLASLLLNSVGLLLAGWFWQSAPLTLPVSHARIKLVTLALPRTSVAPKPPPPPRVRPAPPKPRKPKPIRPQKRLRPGAKVRSSQPAPLAKPAGGAEAGAPVVSAPPPAAPAPPVVTMQRPSLRIVHNIETPTPSLSPTPAPVSLAAAPIVTAAPTPPAAAVSGQGTGVTSQGKGAGKGEGTGTGSGAGAGTSRDAGEPFGVGAGMAGDGGLRHVVYVLDISGSMTSRIDRAESELRHALAGLGPGETFNIIAFSDRIQPFDTGMAPATPDVERRADYFLSTLQVDGGTDLEDALAQALSLPDVNEVVVLTDGVPTVGETDFGALARHVRQMNRRHARFFTVGMVGKNPDGTDDSFEAAQLLQQIARDSGGASKLVPLGVASP